MNANWKNRLMLTVGAALVLLVCVAAARWQPARAEREGAMGTFPHYTVVETEGHNLIVTDNGTNTLHFYTIDRDKEIGSDLHLRGSVDLTQVGKPEIKPTNVKIQK